MNKTKPISRLFDHATLLGVIASLSFAGPSYACECEMPAAPLLPVGAERTKDSMQEAQASVNVYLEHVNDYQQCLLQCITDINLDIVNISQSAEDVVAKWKTTVDEYQRNP